MPGVIGQPRSYYDKFLFLVEFPGLRYAGFMKCSEISAELGIIKHREGGNLVADKSPGLVEVPEITLERGATDDLDTYNWFEEVARLAAGTGQVDDLYKRTGELIQLNRDKTVRQRWRIVKAWPSKFVAGEWDNSAEEKVITSLTLAYDYPEPLIRR